MKRDRLHPPQDQLAKPLVGLIALAVVAGLITLPLATYLAPEEGARLCGLAAVVCLLVGVMVLVVPQWLPVAETYVMVLSLSFGVRMLLPLIACGMLAWMIGVREARVFAICLLIISPLLVFFETWYWTRQLAAADVDR